MSLKQLFQTMSSMTMRSDVNYVVRDLINKRVIKVLEAGNVPWQKPWQGAGIGVGFPKNVFTKKNYFGVNFLLLQTAAVKNDFVSSWWGTAEQFAAVGGKVHPNANGTEILLYRNDISSNKYLSTSIVVYNYDQLKAKVRALEPRAKVLPDYTLAEKALHATVAKIEYNDDGQAWYWYPPHDYITLPSKEVFMAGFGGMPGYYESLAHELTHWTEAKLGFDTHCADAIRELRAEIGSSLLMEELGVPHSISFSNFQKYQDEWIRLMKKDVNLIFKVAASACNAADYIMAHSMKVDERFNQVNENAA